MLVTSSYRVEILNLKKLLDSTLKLSRSAVGWLYPVIDGEWEILSGIQAEKYRFNTAEKLIHTTKKNCAKYAFDAAYPKMPYAVRKKRKAVSALPEPLYACLLQGQHVQEGRGKGLPEAV